MNGVSLQNLKLPELQSLLYRTDGEAVFAVEYDVARHDALDRGPVLVEIRWRGAPTVFYAIFSE